MRRHRYHKKPKEKTLTHRSIETVKVTQEYHENLLKTLKTWWKQSVFLGCVTPELAPTVTQAGPRLTGLNPRSTTAAPPLLPACCPLQELCRAPAQVCCCTAPASPCGTVTIRVRGGEQEGLKQVSSLCPSTPASAALLCEFQLWNTHSAIASLRFPVSPQGVSSPLMPPEFSVSTHFSFFYLCSLTLMHCPSPQYPPPTCTSTPTPTHTHAEK